jgi:hypothetical protein
VGSRKAAGEALTGAHAGWVSSCEIIATGVPTFRMAIASDATLPSSQASLDNIRKVFETNFFGVIAVT